ncbi:MAG: hypothetical protein J5911_02900 [Clostridia bacterium]|nr:hypothetical protein [Clostridia bacterium]
MKKWKASVLLIIVLVVTAILTVMAFARFPIGTKDFNGFLGAIDTDYDLSGGTAYVLTLDKDNLKDVENVDEVINTLKYRLNLLGYENYSVKALKDVDEAVKDYDIRIEARGKLDEDGTVDDATLLSDMKVVAAFGELKFFGGTSQSPTEEILKNGDAVADAYFGGTGSDGSDTYYIISIKFSDYGYNEIKKLIGDSSEYYLRADVGETPITGTSGINIASNFTKDYQLTTTAGESMARQFALQIKTGGLAYKYNVGDGVEVSSPLGKDIALKSVIAIAALIAIVIIAMFVFDKKFGTVSCLSMLLFTDIYLFLLIAIPGIKVAFGGVVGFALAVLLAADGFVITSKRIKEEFAHGKTVKSAVKTGFKRSLAPILGESGIAFAVSLLLMVITSGTVRNFALVLAIGTVVSAVATVLFARMFTNLILPLVGYKENFFGVKRDDIATAAESEGE